ncbi:MAG TPA: hypothetical protein VFD04_03970, partial [Actinomycetes bacterium]|nr:hypothetical protein [Actinomycetes bacterium]
GPGWRPLGPFAIPHGQTYGSGPSSRPGISGRVSSLAVDPRDPAHLLAGAAAGGIWESRDGGASWLPRGDRQPSLAIGALAFDPSRPAVAWAGTGEATLPDRGVGLLRSGNGGASWRLHASGGFVGSGFHALAVDPADPGHLLAVTTTGLHESTDAGASWAPRLAGAYDLSLAGREVLAGGRDGLHRSADGGASWQRVPLPGGPAAYERVAVCHAPSHPAVAWVFAAGGGVGHLWRRGPAGGPLAFEELKPPADLNSSRAWYDWCAAVAPDDPEVVWLGAIDLHRGTRGPGGALAWATVSARPSGDSIHPDQHAIVFAPDDPAVLYVANDGGVYRSPDAGASWRSLHKGLCVSEPARLAAHPEQEAFLLAGARAGGTLRYEGGEVWTRVADGDGGDCAVAPDAPHQRWHGSDGIGLERSERGGWGSWTQAGPPVPDGYDALPYPPLAVGGGLVAQAGVSVLLSADGGRDWVEVPLPAGSGRASTLAVAGPALVWVGTERGQVVRLDLAGGRWTASRRASPRDGWLSGLLVDPAGPEWLWATSTSPGGGRVFRSDDAAATWTDRSAGLPPVPVNAVAADPDRPGTVFVAADVGVYRSGDAGASWAPFGELLPNAPATDLAFHRPTRLLRVALQGRGVWEVAVDAAATAGAEPYLRCSRADTGRRRPPAAGVAEPFDLDQTVWWWQSPDVKLDTPPWRGGDPSAVDAEAFADDHGVAAAGLLDQGGLLVPGQPARVFVQVHNRGARRAEGVWVRVFQAPAALAAPDLPAGFWEGFPDNRPPAGSPWQPVGPAASLGVEPGRARVAAFALQVPATAAANACLLAAVAAEGEPAALPDGPLAAVVAASRRCAPKNVTVLRPPAAGAAPVRALRLDLWGSAAGGPFTIAGDQRATELVAALLLPHPLAALARAAGLEEVGLAGWRPDLVGVVRQDPGLAGRLELSAAFRPPAAGRWLDRVALDQAAPEPLVLLLAEPGRPGGGSLLQLAADGRVVGGQTLVVLPEPQPA